MFTTSEATATVQPPGCTLERYAEAKLLPLDFLRGLALQDMSYLGSPAVRMPYLAVDGTDGAVRFRLAMEGDNRFKWKSGSKPTLYGLHRLQSLREAGYVVLVEGESDCHTLWYQGFPALGVPGAASWREERDSPHLEGFGIIYVIVEPDNGGEAVKRWLSTSSIRHRVKLVDLEKFKDPSALYLADPDRFKANFVAALDKAIPWTEYAATQADAERSAAWAVCSALAKEPTILDHFVEDVHRAGMVGEEKALKVLFLALVSRLFQRPTSCAIKGPSSAGKSYLIESVLRFFPDDAVYVLTAMSERALAYSEEPLSHRFMVIYEAAGLRGDFASYLMRSLLSEGRVRYETVEKTNDGMRPRLIEREGPTGLILTTTAVSLHPENETRLLSIPVTDTQEQTAAILLALAEEGKAVTLNLERWKALQMWLAGGEHNVSIPFAKTLAALVPPVATRLRRDFGAVLALIRAHAVLHQATRERDANGHIIATIGDYEVVRELVMDLVSDGIGATVAPAVRNTVGALNNALESGKAEATLTDIAKELRLDKSTALRRVRVAIEGGYVRNLEERRGHPARLVLGDPLPGDLEVLPPIERLQGCTVAGRKGGSKVPPPPVVNSLVPARPAHRVVI